MRVISYEELKSKKGINFCKLHLRRLERAGKFPKRVFLSRTRVAWPEPAIDAWLEERVAESGRAA